MKIRRRRSAEKENIFGLGRTFCLPVTVISVVAFTEHWPWAAGALLLFYMYEARFGDAFWDFSQWPLSGKLVVYLCPIQVIVAIIVRVSGLGAMIPSFVVMGVIAANLMLALVSVWDMRDMGPIDDDW